MVQLHSASHLKKKDSNTIVVFIIWMGKIPRLKIVRALETSLDVCEKDKCPGYATHGKQSWCCWITGPSPRSNGFSSDSDYLCWTSHHISAWWKLLKLPLVCLVLVVSSLCTPIVWTWLVLPTISQACSQWSPLLLFCSQCSWTELSYTKSKDVK